MNTKQNIFIIIALLPFVILFLFLKLRLWTKKRHKALQLLIASIAMAFIAVQLSEPPASSFQFSTAHGLYTVPAVSTQFVCSSEHIEAMGKEEPKTAARFLYGFILGISLTIGFHCASELARLSPLPFHSTTKT